jgi:hypothetical protein
MSRPPNLEPFARDLFAAWIAHQLRISIAHARREYANTGELGTYWYELAESIEHHMVTAMDESISEPSPRPAGKPQ